MAFPTADQDLENNISPLLLSTSKSELTPPELTNVQREIGPDFGVEPDISDAVEPDSTDTTKTSTNLGTIPSIDVTENYSREFPDADISKPVPNPLHGYASYTYGLSLALMTADEYNKIVKEGVYSPTRVLIASAGRHNNTLGPTQFIRAPHFADDFYFDGLELETVVGLNAQSRNSNAVHYKFTLIEPYGFTLLDRIITLSNELECDNYLDMPYMLQIDFFGIDDTGALTGMIPDTTKRVPIRLNKMDVNMTVKGAEYRIEGVPYNHSAFDLSTVTTPANFEVKAKTISQFFTSSVGSDKNKTETTEKRPIPTIDITTTNSALLSLQTKIDLGLVTSYGTALNNWSKAAYDAGKIGANDTYIFNFLDDEIANSPFTTAALSSPKDTGMAAIDRTNSIYKSSTGANTNDYDPNTRIFQVNAGTYVDRIIAWVIRNSQWMTDQMVIPDGETDIETYLQKQTDNKNKPLYWFKITPSIRLLEFDKIRKIWAREITYNIQKYKVENVKVDMAPQGQAKTPVKAYNYIYTGKNDDILDVDIKFNALYYNALTLYRNLLTRTTPPASPVESVVQSNPDGYNKIRQQDPNAIMPLVMKPVTINTGTTSGSGSTTAMQVAIADVEASLMTMSQADMMNIKLEIIGDPTFIKQDEIFWSPEIAAELENTDPRLTYDGSLKMDNGEVYVSLIFRSPIDRDESTGLMKFDSKYENSLFSGLYRVLTVTNKFRNGQFTQTLNLVRLVRQQSLDYAQNKVSTSDERNNVPGKQAIQELYNQGPDFTPTDATALTQSVDDTGSAQQQQAGRNNIDPPLIGPDQQALRGINETATTQPMTDQNEPATFNPFRGVPSGADAPSQQNSFGQ